MAIPTKNSVLDSISEFDRIGASAFLKKFASGRSSKEWVILQDGRLYEAKAIWAAAHKPPVLPKTFHYRAAESGLRSLGFDIVSKFDTFDIEVRKALGDDRIARLTRLAKAPKKPKYGNRIVIEYFRNQDVVDEALFIANGKCGKCSNRAPFLRKLDSSLYLEVHHKIRLSDGGDDTVENVIALCPNCHREAHYG